MTKLFRASDEHVLDILGTKVVDMVGSVATEVFDADPIATEYGRP